MDKHLADRIRMARRLAGLTQSKAAQLLLVHRGTFGHWERGAGHQPTSANLLRLALILTVSYEWLATGRGSMRISSGNDVATERPDCIALSEGEEQLLLAVRRLPRHRRLSVIEFAYSLVVAPLQVTKPPTAAVPENLHPKLTLTFANSRRSGSNG